MGQKHYSQAYKEEAIQFYLQGHSLLDTLERFGVAQSTLFEWKKRFESRESIPTINVKKERQRREHLEKLALEGIRPARIDGYNEGRWIVLDYANVIVHIFKDEDRVFYHLERLWSNGKNMFLYQE